MKFQSIRELEEKLDPEVIEKAHKLYECESLNIKLKVLRTKYGIKQENMARFTQTAISKLERRKDIKISTLMDYLNSMNMGLEITAIPKDKKNQKEILLKV